MWYIQALALLDYPEKRMAKRCGNDRIEVIYSERNPYQPA